MVTVEIWGKKFPLCLTVAALAEVEEKCGGLDGLAAHLDGKNEAGETSLARMAIHTTWMLGVLIREGEANRIYCARFFEPKAEPVAVPDEEALRHLLTVKSALSYRPAVLKAINESLEREIEAVYPKNAESGERS